MKEVLKAVVFCHRVADDKDFTEQVICIPADQAMILEQELLARKEAGELDVVQIGRLYIQEAPFTDYFNEVPDFLEVIDEVRLHSSKDRVTPSEGEDSGSIPDGASNETTSTQV